MRITTACTPPCTAAPSYTLPGSDLMAAFNAESAGGSDSALTADGGSTSASAGTWTELMSADAARLGASVQNKAASGSVFILPYESGVPSSGTQDGETEIPQAPGYFNFPFRPNQRYVIRGTDSSMAYSLNTW